MKRRRIEIDFPVKVEFPPGFLKTLVALIDMICEKYEEEHPNRLMWPAGMGDKPIWQEPLEPTFDSSILYIEVYEREINEKERIQRNLP
mgnify:CR=1 FL=1